MSNARQLLSVAGQIGGAALGFGPIGAAVGGIIGGELGGLIDGPPEGPRLGDLSAPQIEYGGKIPRFYGGPKWFEVAPLWMSEKREDSEVVGGKGGDSGVEQFSYRMDMLVRVCESIEGTPCEVVAITGIEVDGQLVWTNLAAASAASRAASAEQEIWSDLAVQLGHEDQAPWSVYEAAVGADNANAYRGYLTVGFSDFLLAQGGAPRRVRIQAITVGTQAPSDVIWLLQANGSNGATTTEDSSSYANTPTLSSTELQSAAAEFGSSGFSSVGGGSSSVAATVDHDWTEDTSLTMSCWASAEGDSSAGMWFGLVGPIQFGFVCQGGGGAERYFRIGLFDQTFTSPAFAGGDDHPMFPFGVRAHYALLYNGTTHTATMFKDGVEVLQAAYVGTPPNIVEITALQTFNSINPPPSDGWFTTDGVKVTLGRLEWSEGGFTPPTTAPIDDGAGGWTPGTVDLRDILEYEAGRCTPLTAANIDFSAAEGFPVECHVAIGSAAEAMQPLLTRFWFDLYSSDKLYLVRRGGSVEQTIAHRWSGAGLGGRSESFAGLIRSNDVEVAKKKAITYADILKDGETDTRTGDRESVGTDVDTLPMNLHMRPAQAQGLADTATADARVGSHSATVRLGARHGLLLQPGSVIELIDHQGNTYRTLVRRVVWNRWVWECEVRLDDPNVLQAAGIAVDVDQRALVVAAPPEASLYVLDIPLLRPQDDGPGEYVAVTQTGRFRGVAILKSSDDVTYARVADVENIATAGVCDSELPAFDGWGWDNSSVLTVTLDDGSGGTLSSATKAAIEGSRSLNLAAVGVHGRWELIQFATATLLTGTTYELTGLLRNLFGTEWANADHEAGDSFVLLQANGLARIPGAVSDLGQTRYYKAVPSGRSAGNIAPESIECEEQCLLPYAPVDVWNDAGTVRWNRRSRLEGAIGLDPPLGEASERYDAELYDGVTLEDSDTGLTSPEWTPVDPSGLTVRVYQLSELVGRGHVAEKVVS
jgi:hypothetical protein